MREATSHWQPKNTRLASDDNSDGHSEPRSSPEPLFLPDFESDGEEIAKARITSSSPCPEDDSEMEDFIIVNQAMPRARVTRSAPAPAQPSSRPRVTLRLPKRLLVEAMKKQGRDVTGYDDGNPQPDGDFSLGTPYLLLESDDERFQAGFGGVSTSKPESASREIGPFNPDGGVGHDAHSSSPDIAIAKSLRALDREAV